MGGSDRGENRHSLEAESRCGACASVAYVNHRLGGNDPTPTVHREVEINAAFSVDGACTSVASLRHVFLLGTKWGTIP